MTASVPAIVAHAAQMSERDHWGIIAYRIMQHSAIDGGPIHRRDDVELAAVFDGDTLVRVHVMRHVKNGRVSSPAENTTLAAEIQSTASRDAFAAPFDARHFAEYTYSVEGPSVVRFVGRIRDASHGDGTFTVDPSGHVASMTYAPDAFSGYAHSGSVQVQRAQVLPNFWATVHQVQRIEGGYGFVRGTATVDVTQSGFKRFASRDAAIAAVESNRP